MNNIYSVLKSKLKGKGHIEYGKSLETVELYDEEAERRDIVLDFLKKNSSEYKPREIKGNPLVSIIMLNRDGIRNLEVFIPSLYKCRFYSNYELIVVDNASTDLSVEYLRKWQKKMSITIIQNKKNMTFSKANNIGVKKAKGEYLLFLNNDIQVTDGWLDELLYVAQTKPDAGAVGARLIYPEIPAGTKNEGKSFSVQHAGIGFEDRFRDNAYFLQPYNLENGNNIDVNEKDVIQKAAVTAAVLLVKRSIFEEAGGFDQKYNYGYEDVDLSLHIHYLGYKNYYVPSCTVFHYEFGTQNTDDPEKVKKRRRKNMKVFKCVWQSYLLRETLKDKLAKKHIFTQENLKVSIIIKDNEKECRMLGDSLLDSGYEVEYFDYENLPLAVGIYTDIIIDGTNELNKENYTDTKDGMILVPINEFKEYCAEEFCEKIYKINEYVDPKGIDICGSMPNTDVIQNWGDYHYALALAKSLEQYGYHCVIKTRDEWYERSTSAYTIVLRGKYACYPKIEQKYSIMWNISHPDRVKVEEYNCFDLVYAASEKIEKKLKEKIKVPVKTLMQCTDPDVMTNVDENQEKKYELLFVGNSRLVFRKILQDLLPTDHELTVYGDGWDEFPVKEYVKDIYMPNENVGQAYHDAKILLNDHWDDMKENGIISNRIFDALAAGAFIISDDMPELHKYFKDCLVTYKDKGDLKEKIEYYLTHDDERNKIVGKGRDIVLENHTFDCRAKEIYKDLLKAEM